MLFTKKNAFFNFNCTNFNGACSIKFQYFLNDNIANNTQSWTNQSEPRFSIQGYRVIKVGVI